MHYARIFFFTTLLISKKSLRLSFAMENERTNKYHVTFSFHLIFVAHYISLA